MIGQPEALRLADALEKWAKDYAPTEHWDAMGVESATELRRLHEENKRLKYQIGRRASTELRRLHEVNQELLQALKDSDALITQLMPGVKHIALQDYGFLNTTLINNTKAIAKTTGESK